MIPRCFDLSDQKNEVDFYQYEKECERSRDEDGVEYWEISLRYITFDMLVRQHDSVEQVIGRYVWSLG